MLPNYLPYLKDKIIENDLEFEDIIYMEMLILNKIEWKIFLRSPSELISQLISDISSLNVLNQNYLNDFYNTAMNLINYCFSDLSIYLNFDQFVISINCFLICLESSSEECLSNALKGFLINNLQSLSTIQNIQKCKLYIEKKFYTNKNTNNTYNSDESKNLKGNLIETKVDLNEINLTYISLDNSKISTLDSENNKESICVRVDYVQNYSTIDFECELNPKK